jgi:Glucosamine 6-phosphate synthetase, contains amidotransferase and phosphosugar isomerase domains
LTKDKVEIYDINGNKKEKKPFTVNWDIAAAEKGGYKHFMLKEIYEQPRTITDTTYRIFLKLRQSCFWTVR